MQVEYAELTDQGGRDHNEDRAAIAVEGDSAMLVVCDGMGGHSDGEAAAEMARATLLERFRQSPPPLFDPMGFLHRSLGAAHERVVSLGSNLPLEMRPRATCAICIVQAGSAYWAHVGDSRVYHLRGGKVRERTRDHSHVELLVREGLISDGQVQTHPMRNFVESCVGGDPILPEMAVNPRRPLRVGDILLVCSDGFWGNLEEDHMARTLCSDKPLAESLAALLAEAVKRGGDTGDNASVIALKLVAP